MLNENTILLPSGAYRLNNLTSLNSATACQIAMEMANVTPLEWPGNQQVLNLTMIERLNELDGSGELTRKLINMYFDFSAHILTELCQTTNSLNDLARHIHSLKASSANLGMDRVAAILQYVEHLNSTDLNFMPAVRLLADEIEKGNNALKEWLSAR